jgi:hypothetical protein
MALGWAGPGTYCFGLVQFQAIICGWAVMDWAGLINIFLVSPCAASFLKKQKFVQLHGICFASQNNVCIAKNQSYMSGVKNIKSEEN